MKRKLLLTCVLILCIAAMPLTLVADVASQTSGDFTLDLPCFAPSKITFNFAYTHYASISDITTIGNSTYQYSGNPTTFEFIVTDIDDYFFTFSLNYNQTVNQTILVGFWSGSLAMQGLDFNGAWESVQFHVRLRVTREASYPSEQEVAQAVVSQVQQNIDSMLNEMNQREEEYKVTMLTVVVVSLAAVAVSVVGTVLHIAELRRFRKLR